MSGLTDGDTRTADGGAREDGVREAAVREAAGVGEGEGEAVLGGAVDGGASRHPDGEPLSLAAGRLATATRCGPDLSSPDGIEAQTCVLALGEETWARTYYRNATGEELSAGLSLMAPDGRSVRVHCVVGAQDEPGVCETPRERTRGALEAYTAVSEFAADSGSGLLLLRSGSNSLQPQGG